MLPTLEDIRKTRAYKAATPEQQQGVEARYSTDAQQGAMLAEAPGGALDVSYGLPSEVRYRAAARPQQPTSGTTIQPAVQTELPRPIITGDEQAGPPSSPLPVSEVQPGRTVGGTISDIALTGLKGAVALPQAMVGLADIPTGGRIGRGLERIGYRPGETQEILARALSPAQQYAEKQVQEAKGFVPTLKAAVQHPSVIARSVGESLPLMVGGGAIGRGISKAIPLVSEAAGVAIGEGTIGAGALAEDIRQNTEDRLLTPKQAAAAVGAGVGTAIFSAAGGRLAEELGIADIDMFFAGGKVKKPDQVAKAIVAGGITEGLFEEMPQEMQETVWQNAAMGRPLLEGAPEAGAQALLSGAAMGGGVNLARGVTGEPIVTEEKEQVEDVAPGKVEEVTSPAVASEMFEEVIRAVNTGQLDTTDPAKAEMVEQVREQLRTLVDSDDPAIQSVVSENADVLEGLGVAGKPTDTTPKVGVDEQLPKKEREEIAPETDEEVSIIRAKAIPDEYRTQEEKDLIRRSEEKVEEKKEITQRPAQKEEEERVEKEQDKLAIKRARALPEDLRTPEELELIKQDEERVAADDLALRRAQAMPDELRTDEERVLAESGKPAEVAEAVKPEALSAEQVKGEKRGEVVEFAKESGTLDIPRDEMPQITSSQRGALAKNLRTKGISYKKDSKLPSELKPSQKEYSPEKVQTARDYKGPERAILVSQDGHIVDGHHQWLQKLEDAPNEPIPVIELGGKAEDVIRAVKDFPGAKVAEDKATPTEVKEGPEPLTRYLGEEEGPTAPTVSKRRKIEEAKKFQEERRDPKKHTQITEQHDYKKKLPSNTERLMNVTADRYRAFNDAQASVNENKEHLERLFEKAGTDSVTVNVDGQEFTVKKPKRGKEQVILNRAGRDALDEIKQRYKDAGLLTFDYDRGGTLMVQPSAKGQSKAAAYGPKTLEAAAIEHVQFMMELAEARFQKDAARKRIKEKIIPKLEEQGLDQAWTNKKKDATFWVERAAAKKQFATKEAEKAYEKERAQAKAEPEYEKKRVRKLGAAGISEPKALGLKRGEKAKRKAAAEAELSEILKSISGTPLPKGQRADIKSELSKQFGRRLIESQQKRGVFEIVSSERAARALQYRGALKSISQDINEKLQKLQVEYDAAVKKEDKAKAGKIVDSAASLAGFDRKIPQPVLSESDIERISRMIGYGVTEEAVEYLRNKDITHIDAYRAETLPEALKASSDGYSADKEWYGRDPAVYLFLDPDDIRYASPFLSMRIEEEIVGGDIGVVHFKIPIESLLVAEHDGFFANSFGTYSSILIKDDVPAESIVGVHSTSLKTPKEYEDNRKPSPIVRDEDGNVLSLEERFFTNNIEPRYSKDNQRLEGLTFPDGTVWLIDGNIETGTATEVFSHELGVHARKLGFKEEKSFNTILKRIEALSKTDKDVKAARQRVPADTPAKNVNEETLAYLVSDAPQHGVVKRLIASLKKFLAEKGWFRQSLDKLTPSDLQALAQSAVRADTPPVVKAAEGVNEFAQSAKMSIAKAADKIKGMANFKKWIGGAKLIEKSTAYNWGVDKTGSPIVVRLKHGTNQDFVKFEKGLKGQDIKGATSKTGFWFTDSQEEALQYARYSGQRTVANAEKHEEAVDNLLERIEEAEENGDWDLSEKLNEELETLESRAIQEETEDIVMDVFVKMDNPLIHDSTTLPDQEAVINNAINDGYDGVVFVGISDSPYKKLVTNQAVVFNPTQIKSIHNTGEWSPTDPDIMKSLSKDEQLSNEEGIFTAGYQIAGGSKDFIDYTSIRDSLQLDDESFLPMIEHLLAAGKIVMNDEGSAFKPYSARPKDEPIDQAEPKGKPIDPADEIPRVGIENMSEIIGVDRSTLKQEFDRVKNERSDEIGLAPNGEKSNLSDDLWVMVRTPRFKKWFGDWEKSPEASSRVVDENGEPIFITHYDRDLSTVLRSFEQIKRAWKTGTDHGKLKDGGLIGNWFYSAYMDETQQGYGDVKIDGFLNIRKPLPTDVSRNEFHKVIKDQGYFSEHLVKKNSFITGELIERDDISKHNMDLIFDNLLSTKVHKSKRIDWHDLIDGYTYGTLWNEDNEQKAISQRFQITETVMDLGYDGYIAHDRSWVAFDPKQVKSMENVGSFSLRHPDIMFSMSAPAQKARRNTENLNATKDGQSSTATAEAGNKAISSIMETLRKASKATEAELSKSKSKEQKFIARYRQLLDNPDLTIQDGTALLSDFARQGDVPAGTKARIGQLVKQITAAKRPETQQKRLADALGKLEVDISRRLRTQVRNQIKRAAGPKREGAIKRGRYWHEQEKDMASIREAVYMAPGDVQSGISSAESTLDRLQKRLQEADPDRVDSIRKRITDAELRLHNLKTYGNLAGKNIDDLLSARFQAEEVRRLGRSNLRAVKDAWQKDINTKVEWFTKEITGQDQPKPETAAQKARRKEKEKKLAGRAKGAYEAVENSVQSWEHLLDRIAIKSGKKIFRSRAVKEFGSMAHAGQRNVERYNRQATDKMLEKGLEIFGVKKGGTLTSRLQKLGKKTEEIRVEGDKLQLSPLEAAYLYNVRKEAGADKIFRKMGFTAESFQDIDKLMSKELKDWANYLYDYLLSKALQGETEAYRAINGVDRTPVGLFREGQEDIPIMNMNSAIMNRIFDANHYRAWAVPSKTFNDIFSDPEIRGYTEQHAGTSTLMAVDKFLEDFAKSPRELRGDMAWMDKLRSNVVMSMIGANPTTFFKQLTSIPAYAADIPTAAFVKNFAHGLANFGRVKKMIDSSGMAKERFEAGFDRDIHEASKATAEQVIGGKVTRVRDILMLGTKIGDKMAIYAGYTVYKHHYDKAKRAGKSNKEAHEKGVLEFELATERTQQAGAVKDLGAFQRGGSLQKLLTMYMTSPAAYTRQTMAAIRHFPTDPVGSSKRILLFNVMLPMMFQAVASGFLGAGGEDEDEMVDFWQKELRAVALGPFLGIPIARDVAAGIWESAMGSWYGSDVQHSPVTETTKSLTQAIFQASKGLKEGDEDAMKRAGNDFLDFLGYIAGLPTRPTRRLWEGWEDFLSGETEHPFMAASGYSRSARKERYLGE